jgi:hypothetical protein
VELKLLQAVQSHSEGIQTAWEIRAGFSQHVRLKLSLSLDNSFGQQCNEIVSTLDAVERTS